jgi:hypothetical protein
MRFSAYFDESDDQVSDSEEEDDPTHKATDETSVHSDEESEDKRLRTTRTIPLTRRMMKLQRVAMRNQMVKLVTRITKMIPLKPEPSGRFRHERRLEAVPPWRMAVLLYHQWLLMAAVNPQAISEGAKISIR